MFTRRQRRPGIRLDAQPPSAGWRPLPSAPRRPELPRSTEPMPEAVIVDAVRSPIGRAFKGSLAQLRPEETAAFVVDQLLERNPDVDPALIEDVFCGCGMPQGLQAFNIARIIALLSEQLTAGGHRDDDLALLRLLARRDPPRRERDQGRRGRRLHRRRGRVRLALQRAHRARRRRRPNPNLIGENGQPERLHRHGPDRGQRREEVRGQPRRHGQVRAALAGARGRLAGGRLLRPRDRPGRRPGRQRGRQGRRPARVLDAREARRSSTRRSAAAASPPATRARSTTAPPRS